MPLDYRFLRIYSIYESKHSCDVELKKNTRAAFIKPHLPTSVELVTKSLLPINTCLTVRRAVAKRRLVSKVLGSAIHFQYHHNVDAVTIRILPWVADNSGYFHMYENKILKLSFVVQWTLEDIFTFQPFLHVIWRCNCRKNLNWSSQIYYFLTKVCVFSVF